MISHHCEGGAVPPVGLLAHRSIPGPAGAVRLRDLQAGQAAGCCVGAGPRDPDRGAQGPARACESVELWLPR